MLVKSKSTTTTTRRNSEIVVKQNAPNWPAMVENRKSNHLARENKSSQISAAASSLWLQSRQFKKGFETAKSTEQLPKMEKFASKTFLIRQCTKCQILYSSFHQCSGDEAEGEAKELFASRKVQAFEQNEDNECSPEDHTVPEK
jgi:hypothetical protein